MGNKAVQMKEFLIKKEEMYFDTIASYIQPPLYTRLAVWQDWLESGMSDFMYSYRSALSIDPSEINNAFGGLRHNSISFRWFYFYEMTIDTITYIKAGHSKNPTSRCESMKKDLSFSNQGIIVGEPTIFPLGFLTQRESLTIEQEIFCKLKNLGALERTPFIVETFVGNTVGILTTLFDGATEMFQYTSDDEYKTGDLIETIEGLAIIEARRLECVRQLKQFKILNWLRA